MLMNTVTSADVCGMTAQKGSHKETSLRLMLIVKADQQMHTTEANRAVCHNFSGSHTCVKPNTCPSNHQSANILQYETLTENKLLPKCNSYR